MADVYTKAGLMLRRSLEAGRSTLSSSRSVTISPATRTTAGWSSSIARRRTDRAPASTAQPLPPQPDFPVSFPDVWLKLVRDGDTITGKASQDGEPGRRYASTSSVYPLRPLWVWP